MGALQAALGEHLVQHNAQQGKEIEYIVLKFGCSSRWQFDNIPVCLSVSGSRHVDEQCSQTYSASGWRTGMSPDVGKRTQDTWVLEHTQLVGEPNATRLCDKEHSPNLQVSSC